MPRGELPFLGFCKASYRYETATLFEALAPERAISRLVIPRVRYAPRCIARLRQNEAPCEIDKLSFAVLSETDDWCAVAGEDCVLRFDLRCSVRQDAEELEHCLL